MPRIAVAPHPYFRNETGTPLEIVDLVEALDRTYPTDAHFVTYLVRGTTEQPRLGMHWRERYRSQLEVEVLTIALDEIVDVPCMRGAISYTKRKGMRLLRPLKGPVPVDEAIAQTNAWLDELHAAGVPVNTDSNLWSAMHRLPRVTRQPAFVSQLSL